MKSWKTTLGGVLAAVGAACAGNANSAVAGIGQVCSVAGALILGFAARDNKVTSEQAGAK